jgi:hypothetical protein
LLQEVSGVAAVRDTVVDDNQLLVTIIVLNVICDLSPVVFLESLPV